MIAARVRANLKMKAVSCVYQKAPHTAFFIKGNGIAAPKDLEGKKLGFSAGNSPKIMFPAFAAANHIDQSKLNWLAADPNSLNSLLLNHQADVILTYLFTLPVLQKSRRTASRSAPSSIRISARIFTPTASSRWKIISPPIRMSFADSSKP